MPLLQRRVFHTSRAADARVVHEDVELAEAAHRRRDGAFPVRLTRHVEGDEGSLAAPSRQLRFECAAFGVEDVAHDDAGALLGEESSGGGADAARATADERDLPGESRWHGREHIRKPRWCAAALFLRSSGGLGLCSGGRRWPAWAGGEWHGARETAAEAEEEEVRSCV
jgi:hypothetical protein